jgi:SAM-dependent methyltransferase
MRERAPRVARTDDPRIGSLAKPCVVCGTLARRRVLDIGSFVVSKCPGCAMHTLWPEPDHVVMEEFNDGSGYEGAFDFRDELMQRHARTLAQLEKHVARGKLLDVGCGPAFLLEAARERGWHATGVDPSPFSVARARKLGFEAHEGMLEDLAMPDASFDAIALLQVVEHMTDPRPLLAECRRLLRPGGALVVATPNPQSVLAKVKRERFNYWIPPVHCAWYTPDALSKLLKRNGFAPVRESTWSARARRLHDGIDAVAATKLGAKLPRRVQRPLGSAVSAVADLAGYGSIVEHIAVRWEAE